MPTYENLVPEYLEKWSAMEISPAGKAEADDVADKIIANRARYEEVSKETGVPWYLIGIIHNRECTNLSFKQHLHNGDPLTAKTVQVPAGRPKGGIAPYTWKESAIDALRMKKLHLIKEWSVDRIAYELERYNGWGYRRADINIPSPYLWSKSDQYTRGKFIKDHVYSRNVVDKQLGTMVVLKCLIDKCDDISFGGAPAEAKLDKEIVKNSNTLTALQRIRLFIRTMVASGVGLFTWENAMQAKSLVVDNSGWILLIGGGIVLLTMEYTKFIEKQSVESFKNGEWALKKEK